MDLVFPPGPAERYASSEDLLQWIGAHFNAFGDIYRASVYGSNVYVISAPEYAEHVLLRHWQNYVRKGQVVKRISLLLGNGLIGSNGDFWANQRRMIQPAFTRPAVAGLTGIITRANEDLLDQWKRAALEGERVNVTRDVSRMVLKITLQCLFGGDYGTVVEHCSVLADDSSRNLAFVQALRPLGDVLVRLARQRRRSNQPGADIFGTLIQARDRDHGQPMSDAQIAKETMTLIVAGHETTATALNWIWYLLARHPLVEARLSRELGDWLGDGISAREALPRVPYTASVIEEALRLYPPLWLMTRHALADDWIGGYFVPAGTEIYISPYLIQRHPGLWQMPERFDPDRFGTGRPADRPLLGTCPFGAGPRNCIGEGLARAEMQIHLMTIARELRLLDGDPAPAEAVAGMNLVSRKDFVMTPVLKSIASRSPGAHLGLPRHAPAARTDAHGHRYIPS